MGPSRQGFRLRIIAFTASTDFVFNDDSTPNHRYKTVQNGLYSSHFSRLQYLYFSLPACGRRQFLLLLWKHSHSSSRFINPSWEIFLGSSVPIVLVSLLSPSFFESLLSRHKMLTKQSLLPLLVYLLSANVALGRPVGPLVVSSIHFPGVSSPTYHL